MFQADTMGLEIRIFKAIDGKRQDHPLFKNYDDNLRMRKKGKSMTPAQIGCFASHYLLWETCAKRSEPVIILEDDVDIFNDTFLKFYQSVRLLNKKYECVRLFDNKSKHHRAVAVERMNGLEIAKFTKGHMGTTGYYLNPNGAKKFIRGAKNWFLPVDIYMDRFWDHHVECYGTIPACLTNDTKFHSTIASDRAKSEKRSLEVKVQREIFSACEQIRRRIHNLKFQTSLFWGDLKNNFRSHQ